MPKLTTHRPPMTHTALFTIQDLDRFADMATIHDRPGFVALLNRLTAERVSSTVLAPDSTAALTDVAGRIPSLAEALEREPLKQLAEYLCPNNIPVTQYGILVNKSRQQIYKDLDAGRLLGISLHARGVRLPNWQLMPAQASLTREVLKRLPDEDPWKVYWALKVAGEDLDHYAPITIVTLSQVDKVADVVCARLRPRS